MHKRVLIVEDQTTLRELLEELLGGAYEVVSCATGSAARALFGQQTFDLVLLDLMLPDAHGLELLTELRALRPAAPRARALILTAHAKPAVIRDAMARGAHAVVSKGAPLRELREAIDRVSAGGFYYCSETSRLLQEAMSGPASDPRLTDRQLQILRLVASGQSSKEIASTLALSEKTVQNHRARIMEKLDLHDVASLTRYAMSVGLIDPTS